MSKQKEKQKSDKAQAYQELKQQQTNLQKLLSTLYCWFIREQKQSPQINHAVIAATYFQILGTINIIVLFTVFSNTNSQTYSIIQSSLCILLILIDIIPKVSKKHIVFNFVSISEGLILASMIICAKLLLDNYIVFYSHCQDFAIYHSSREYVIGPKNQILAMCEQISMKFLAEVVVGSILAVCKIIHLGLYVRAYRHAKEKYDDEERKKRRKDRYNEMIRKRHVFNEKRKA